MDWVGGVIFLLFKTLFLDYRSGGLHPSSGQSQIGSVVYLISFKIGTIAETGPSWTFSMVFSACGRAVINIIKNMRHCNRHLMSVHLKNN